jgi:hypothetical protein
MRIGTLGFGAFVVAALAAPLAASPAQAAVYEFQLVDDHCTGTCGGGTGPDGQYGTVTISDVTGSPYDSVHVALTLYPPAKFVATGAGESLMFSIFGNPAIDITNLTDGWVEGGSDSTGWSGEFQHTIHCDLCGSGASNPQPGPVYFDISSAGQDITTADFLPGVIHKNGKPDTYTLYYFVADIIGQNGKTGNVGAFAGEEVTDCTNPDGCEVPEPATLTMFSTWVAGFAAAAALRRRKKNRKAV